MKQVVIKTKFLLMTIIVTMMIFTLIANNSNVSIFAPILTSAQIVSLPVEDDNNNEDLTLYIFTMLQIIYQVGDVVTEYIYEVIFRDIILSYEELFERDYVPLPWSSFVWQTVFEEINRTIELNIRLVNEKKPYAPEFLLESHLRLYDTLIVISDYMDSFQSRAWYLFVDDTWEPFILDTLFMGDISYYNLLQSLFTTALRMYNALWELAVISFKHDARNIVQNDPALVGRWVWADGIGLPRLPEGMEWVYMLYADGTGTRVRAWAENRSEIRWATIDGVLWIDHGPIIYLGFRRFNLWDYTIENNVLTLKSRLIGGSNETYIQQPDY